MFSGWGLSSFRHSHLQYLKNVLIKFDHDNFQFIAKKIKIK